MDVKEPLPSHEFIVEAIRYWGGFCKNDEGMRLLLSDLIIHTKIPKGHDAIIAALNDRMKRVDGFDELKASVLAQKVVAEAEVAAKQDEVSAENKVEALMAVIREMLATTIQIARATAIKDTECRENAGEERIRLLALTAERINLAQTLTALQVAIETSR